MQNSFRSVRRSEFVLSDQFPQPAADGVRIFQTQAGRVKADDAAGSLRRINVDRRSSVLQRNADVHAGHLEAPLEREDEPGCRAAGAHFGPGVAERAGGRIEALYQTEQAVMADLRQAFRAVAVLQRL